ncbi:hypothetical protein PTKIN_Ptkin11bG0096300 [Pterospermum kingtungense]
MASLRLCLLQNNHFSLFNTNHSTLISHLIQHCGNSNAKKTSSSSSWMVHAVDEDSQQFEVDPQKAKEALQQLDQQLQTLSKKQRSTPKIRASDVKLTRDEMVEDSPEISVSFLTYLTVGLLIFTIFYNVLFFAVIKPSIDGPESAPEPTNQTESRGVAAVLQ